MPGHAGAWAFFLLLLFPLWAEAAIKYATATGAGDGTGSSVENACNGVCSASAGDTVYLCGAWPTIAFAQSGSSGNPIIYDGSCPTGAAAVVTATGTTNALTFTTLSGSRYLTVKNITYSSVDAHGVYIDGDDDITLDGLTCTGTGSTDRSCVSLLGSVACDRITVQNSSLSGATYYGISYQVSGAALAIAGPTITDNEIFDNDAGGIRLTIESAGYATSKFSGPTITDNNVYNFSKTENGAGIWVRTGDPAAAPTVFSTGVVITDNTVSDMGTASFGVNGINCGNCDGAVITDNTVEDAYVAGAGITTLGTINSRISGNTVRRISSNNSIDGGGIFADLYSDSNVIERNFIEDCETAGNDNNSGQGIGLFSAASNRITANIIRNCKVGIGWSGTRTDLNEIHHNDISHASVAGIGKGTVEPTNVTTALDVRNNIISTAGKCIISFSSPLASADYNNCHLADYDATQSAGANDLTAAPARLGGQSPTTAEGFRLSANSPLIAAGTDLGDEFADYFGDTFYNGSVDIGAFRRDSCYRRSRDGNLDMARTRAQVASRCLGIPGRYPEGL